MRTILVAVPALLLTACPEVGLEESREMTIVVEADTEKLKAEEAAIAAREAELARQRDEILKERQALVTDGSASSDIKALVSAQKRLLEQERALREAEARLEAQRRDVSQEKSKLLEGVVRTGGAAAGGGGGGGAPVAAVAKAAEAAVKVAEREKEIATRERSLAAREADLARREKDLAARESQLASREGDLGKLAAAGVATIAPSEPGRRVRRRDVVRAHQQVRSLMRKRGILKEDLPPQVAALDQQFYQDSKAGRWAQAQHAVADLQRSVLELEVDETFIQSKMARLNRLRKKKSLSGPESGQVDTLLAQATSAFADGQHGNANAMLNQIFAILSK